LTDQIKIIIPVKVANIKSANIKSACIKDEMSQIIYATLLQIAKNFTMFYWKL